MSTFRLNLACENLSSEQNVDIGFSFRYVINMTQPTSVLISSFYL